MTRSSGGTELRRREGTSGASARGLVSAYMWISDAFGVQCAAGRVAYADGAEEQVLAELLETVDRSDGSDELAARARDWAALYHFSPKRSNLLRPLTVRPGMRVLEVGCGTGALTRWLGEQHARVLAVDGNVIRARATAVRCEGLPNVEVVAGTLDDVPAEAVFDLVVVVGVLEYASVFLDEDDGPRQFLQAVRQRQADHGALVLAIENQLGLKYLLGYAEDHLGLPWVGVEGYSRTAGARTWNRRVLGDMLRSAGFPAQRWLFPFPDYKLPSIVIDERLYLRPNGHAFIDQLVRSPVSAEASPPNLLCDARLAHRQLLTAGLGPEVANSFLVVAGREPGDFDELVGPEAAWLFGDARRRLWRRQRTILESNDSLHLADRSEGSQARSLGWLRQANDSGLERPLVPGDPLDILIFEAIRRQDLGALSELLLMWRSELESHGQPTGTDVDATHPFAASPGSLALPGDFLDVLPSNFISNNGTLTFIDREWIAPAPVSAEIVQVRAMWYLGRELVDVGEPHPWGSLATVDEVCQALCALAGINVKAGTLPLWREAEAELQHLVGAGDIRSLRESLDSMSSRRTVDVSPRALPFTALRASLDAARQETDAAQAKISDLEDKITEWQKRCATLEVEAGVAAELRIIAEQLDARIAEAEGRIAEADARLLTSQHEAESLRAQLAESESKATELGHAVNRLRAEIKAWSQRMARIEQLLPVRMYRLARRLAPLPDRCRR
jgi:O-antigen biosynthesis protein